MTASTARRAIEALLNPRSIAVVGATERPGYGSRLVRNLLDNGFAGSLWPVNPNRPSVFGLACVGSVLEIPEAVDLAALVIPAESVSTALDECREKGIPTALVISAGFAESPGPVGETLQASLALGAAHGPRICGPNCLGVANVPAALWATANVLAPVDERIRAGSVAVVSQSGATAFGPLLSLARERGIGLRYLVSSGNEVDLTTADYVDYFVGDRGVRSVAIVLEGVRDGEALKRAFERAQVADKPVVVLKIGRTAVGAAAALSHTAAMTGADDVFDELLDRYGVARANDWDQLLELADGLGKPRRPAGSRVAVVSHSGGIGGLVADACAARGLALAPLGRETEAGLSAVLDGRGAARNPADVTGHFERETFETILALLLHDPSFDAVAVATGGSTQLALRIAAAAESSEKPVVVCWTAGIEDSEPLRLLRGAGVPITFQPDDAAHLLAALASWSARRLEDGPAEARSRDAHGWAKLQSIVGRGDRTLLSERDGLDLLRDAGVPAVRSVTAGDPGLAVAATRRAGLPFPVAVKIDSPDIAHKSRVGGVRLGVAGESELESAARSVLHEVRSRAPDARLRGVVVQEMAPSGLELLLGLRCDPQLGPAIVLGLGGTLAELLGSHAVGLAPMRPVDVERLVDCVPRLSALLDGSPERPAYDRAALVDAVCAFAAWGSELWRSLETAEVNPLIVLPRGRGVLAADCLIVPAAI